VNTAVARVESSRLVSAKPMYAADAMLIVALPAVVHDVPFEET
jgi:hypothetical protein